jgi:hypothetical protein
MTQRHASNLRRDALATFLLAALGAAAAGGDCPVGLDAGYGNAGIAFHDFGEPVILGGSHWRPDGSLLIAVEKPGLSGSTFTIEKFDAAGNFSGSPFYTLPATMTARDVAAGFGGENDVTFSGEKIDSGLPDVLIGCLDDDGALDTVSCAPEGYMALDADQDVRITGHDAVDGCAYAVGRGDVDAFGDDIALAHRLCPAGDGGFTWSANFYVANGETTAIFSDQDLFRSTAGFDPWPVPIEPAAAESRSEEPNGAEQLFRWEVGKSGNKAVICLYLHDDILIGCKKFEPPGNFTDREFLAVVTARNGDAIAVERSSNDSGEEQFVLHRISAESGESIFNLVAHEVVGQIAVLFPEDLENLYDEIVHAVSAAYGDPPPILDGPHAAAAESEACLRQRFGDVSRSICPFAGDGAVDSDLPVEIHTRPVESAVVPCTDTVVVATTDDGQGIAVAKLQLSALVIFNEDHESGGFGGWTAVP